MNINLNDVTVEIPSELTEHVATFKELCGTKFTIDAIVHEAIKAGIAAKARTMAAAVNSDMGKRNRLLLSVNAPAETIIAEMTLRSKLYDSLRKFAESV